MSSEPLNNEQQNDNNYALYSPVKTHNIQLKRNIKNECLSALSFFFILLSSSITLIFNSLYFIDIYNNTMIYNITNIPNENKYFIYILLYNSCLSLSQMIHFITSCPDNINTINAFAIVVFNCVLSVFDQILPLSYVSNEIYNFYFYGKIIIALYFVIMIICNCIYKRT